MEEDLPPLHRLHLLRLQAEHGRAFADFPRTRSFILLTLRGLTYMQRPNLHDDLVEGPQLMMSPRGVVLLPDVRRPRRQ